MKPKLKEDPREWRKFAWAALTVLVILTVYFWRRGMFSVEAFLVVLGAVLVLAVGATLRPQPVRPIYRVAMTVGFCLGQVIGRVLLALAFILVVTPLGVLLRLTGKDLLHLRRDPRRASHWRPAQFTSHFDRQF